MNWTQQDVADKLGISRGTYAHYEINKREPDLATVSKLADLFGVTVDYLVSRTTSQGQKVANEDVSPERAEFLQWVEDNLEETFFYDFHKSPEEQKEELMETLRLLWEQEKRRAKRNRGE